MADQFIGITVFLALNDPEQTQVRGLVADVAGQELVLSNAFFPKTGHNMREFRVHGTLIGDIRLPETGPSTPAGSQQPTQPIQEQHTSQHTSVVYPPQVMLPTYQPYQQQYYNNIPNLQQHRNMPPQQSFAPPPPRPSAPPPLEDPAILSMTRKPSAVPVRPQVAQAIQPNALSLPPQPSFTLTTPTRTPATIGLSRQASSQDSGVGLPVPTDPWAVHPNAAAENNRPSPATLQPPFATMSLHGDNAAESSTFDETDDASLAPPTSYNQRNKFAGRRVRKGKQFANKQPDQSSEPSQQEDSVVLQPGMFGGAVAQAAAASAGRGFVQPGSRARITKRRQRHENGHCMNVEEEGWATEDVNDYKEREFDFQSNLDRFDKKSVFRQIKAEDNTADEARLVSFNRLPQRKPPPKKNYHPSENVLGNYASGKGLADRDGWPTPEFIAEQSEDSDDEDEIRGRNAGAVESGRTSRRALSRRQSDSARRRQLSVGGRVSVEPLSSSGSAVLNKPVKPSFRLTPSNRPCPIVSPLQMLDVERIAEVELGLTDDMMTENAGRGIAQVAIQAFGKRISATNHNALPVVLVFAGNNKSGARAIAAGRHLKNHHVRVMVCVLGLEREDELLENVKRQLNIFRNAGGRVARWEELQNNLKQIDSPPELIIDGLLGMHLGFEDLRTDDQAIAFELVQFANKSKASVLSVDVPSGVDGSSGEIAQLEDTDAFYMRAKWVVCMGAPKSGLLHANISSVGAGWNLYVADIGISNTAWRKYGTRRRHGVEFAAEWVVGLTYHSGSG